MRRKTEQLPAGQAEAVACAKDVVRLGATSMPVCIYGSPAEAERPVVVHLHAGAFVGGSLESGRPVSALLAEAGAIVVSADYPLAPRHPFPQAVELLHRFISLMHAGHTPWAQRRSRIFVAGEEAGGNLAAGLALLTRDRHAPALAGQILLSPMLDPRLATCSLRAAAAGPVGCCRWADGWRDYLGSPAAAAHPYAAPLGSSRLTGVAPALVVTAQDDPLRDEALSYARRLRESGVGVETHVLSAPTGWPCALTRKSSNESWSANLRARFSTFFANTPDPLLRSPALHLSSI